MIASLADHGIARTRWGSRPAGCFAAPRAGAVRTRRPRRRPPGARVSLLGGLLAGTLLAGCGLIGGPVVTVENHSPWRVDSLWVVATGDSTRVPPLAPGASAQVRVRAQGEDLLVLRGHASGHVLAPSLGAYVEGAGSYRLRAVVGESGAVTVVETKVGGAAY